MSTLKTETPLRIGVFADVASANRAVSGLLAAGFTTQHISVVCSDDRKERFFREFEHELPAGTTTPAKAVTGGAVGAVAAGIAAVIATGGVGLIVLGPVLTGAVAGTFVGAMVSRGVESSIANEYDQALRDGDILVAAEIEPDGDRTMLARAEQVLAAAGARPQRLQKG